MERLLWFALVISVELKEARRQKKHGESRWFPYLLNLAKVAAFFWSSISDNLYKHTKVRKVKKRALICTLNVPTLPFIVGIFQYVHSPLTSSGRISSHPYTMHGHVEVYASCKLFVDSTWWNTRLHTAIKGLWHCLRIKAIMIYYGEVMRCVFTGGLVWGTFPELSQMATNVSKKGRLNLFRDVLHCGLLWNCTIQWTEPDRVLSLPAWAVSQFTCHLNVETQ